MALDDIKMKRGLFGDTPMLKMKDRIGFLPISIWQPDWTLVKNLKKIVGDKGGERTLKNKPYGWIAKGNKNISIFNPHLAQMILSAYCPSNANIYDPFGGGGTRGFIANSLGHSYVGIELRREEVDRIKKQQKELNMYFDIICGDSREYNIEENYFDFSYTCPPYYNLEIYSGLDNDMSNAKTYDDFLCMLGESLIVNYKGLKSGCLSVWVVGNFRGKNGDLTHFNGDLVWLGKEVGFNLHDELIFWGASKCAVQRCGQFEANRKSVRVHEYIIIFKKP